jgi:hypothetical protein
MEEIVDFADLAREESVSRPNFAGHLKYVALSDNETQAIMFTTKLAKATVHYCKESEIRGYALCSGSDCLLCRIGVKQINMRLTPVYLPATEEIEVLHFTHNMKPGALYPQLLNVFANPLPQVLFLRKDEGNKFHLSVRPVPKGVDFGEARISAFMADFESKKIELSSIYASYTNTQLGYVQGIRQILQIKGIPVPVLEGITPSSAEYESVNEPEAAVTSDFLKFVV